MNATLNFAVTGPTKRYVLPLVLIAISLTGTVMAFPLSYFSNTNVLVGLCLLPFVVIIRQGERFNYLLLALVTATGFVAYVYELRIAYFFALAFFLVFVVELTVGKMSTLIFFLICFMSPFFEQVAVILGFPLRLLLSQWAGTLLAFAGMDVQVDGNLMFLNGDSFSVDEACMGLRLLSISLLMGVFVMAHRYRRTKLELPFHSLLAFFGIVFLLNIFTNILRIMLLVAFKIQPENPMHEMMGMLCLVLYVMVPLYFISNWMMRKFGCVLPEPDRKILLNRRGWVWIFVLGFGVSLLGMAVGQKRARSATPHAEVELPGYTALKMKDGITRLSNEELLIYIKPIPEFFSGEHTPLICWQGSGYNFKSIRKSLLNGRELYTGVLSKAGSTLCTAWWYTNGEMHAVDQMEWRTAMLRGEPKFCLVNVTANNEATLYKRLTGILESNLITNQDGNASR
jgi:exosortase N